MDENRIEGTARNLGGKAEEAFGKVTRDARKQTDGLGESSCRRRSGPLWPSGGHRARDGNDL